MPNIEIRNMNGQWATFGYSLEDDCFEGPNGECVPKLIPGEVVEVEDDHHALQSQLIMVTAKKPNRQYFYPDRTYDHARRKGDAKAAMISSMVEASVNYNKRWRDGEEEPEVESQNNADFENQVLRGQVANLQEQISAMMTMMANGQVPGQVVAQAGQKPKVETVEPKPTPRVKEDPKAEPKKTAPKKKASAKKPDEIKLGEAAAGDIPEEELAPPQADNAVVRGK